MASEKNKPLDPTLAALKMRLDETTSFPSVHVFKFIVPKAQFPELESLFKGQPTSTRESKFGNYISLTVEPMMISSDEVIQTYQSALKIKGIICL